MPIRLALLNKIVMMLFMSFKVIGIRLSIILIGWRRYLAMTVALVMVSQVVVTMAPNRWKALKLLSLSMLKAAAIIKPLSYLT